MRTITPGASTPFVTDKCDFKILNIFLNSWLQINFWVSMSDMTRTKTRWVMILGLMREVQKCGQSDARTTLQTEPRSFINIA